MEPTQDNYPVFEPNQVLSYSHLNQLFDYLDEQERLTRANLIGIGIVCGLQIRFDPDASPESIHLSRGCGVTSQGYLIVEPDDVALVSYRPYTLPPDLDYPPFKEGANQFQLWELFPAGEPETTPLGDPAGFLENKALLLFLELKKEDLRNCCANNCDDQGSAVAVTVRRLLIARDDLDKVIEAAGELEAGALPGGLSDTVAAELGLEDIRLPRYDVPGSNPVTSVEVLAAFQAVFRPEKLVQKTATILSAAYQAFKPLLADLYPDDPFATFTDKFGFLDATPQTPAQVRFLQYYYDLFDDLFKAYAELREKGVGLICACTPPEGLFPRHLMLGLLLPEGVANAASYRHHFLPSPATGRCGAFTGQLRQLFQRLVELTVAFTNDPPLPESGEGAIRITPSKLADVPLSDKAIPYYYRPDGTPPINTIWNEEKTRRNRANQNLGYHSDRYQPPAPEFVTRPLEYDLEPYNFLRIEGHLGRDFRAVLRALLLLRNRFRLPIEIVALRTGAFDERIPVDLSKEDCRFRDLEALYDTLKDELACFLCKEVKYFYGLPQETGSSLTVPAPPKLPMLVKCAPGFLVQPNTLGRLFEDWFAALPGGNLAAIDLNLDLRFVARFNILLFLIAHLARLHDVLAKDLTEVDFPELEKRCQELVRLTEAIENQREQGVETIDGNVELLKWEELDDRLEAIIYNCSLDAFKALRAEYERRIKDVKQKQFLSFFQKQHPGLQHKAGVPPGGTFVLVYHETPAPVRPPRGVLDLSDLVLDRLSLFRNRALSGALDRLAAKPALMADPDLRLVFGELTGEIPRPPVVPVGEPETGGIFAETIRGMADGTVIADFFLPYLCCSDCAPVQFVLPAPPLRFSVQLACTSAETNSAEATVTPLGGTAPYSYQLDGQPFTELRGGILLAAGSHNIQIRDSAGAESRVEPVNVPRALAISDVRFIDDAAANSYRVTFAVSGGTAPYRSDAGTVTGNVFTSNPVTGGATVSVTITDKAGCEITREFQHTVCTLPCGGQSRRCNYRLWIQPPVENELYETYRQQEMRFRFNGDNIELPPDLLQFEAVQLNNDFEDTISAGVKRLNAAINSALIQKLGEAGRDRLVVSYEPAAVDPFRSLRIEYFVCDVFAIEFDYSYGQPTPSFALTMRYGNEHLVTGAPFDGAVLLNRRLNKRTAVPAFDCSERNQCDVTDYSKLCDGVNPQPVITIERLPGNQIRFQFTGSVVDTSQTIAAWVWDVFTTRSSEPFYEGQQVVADLDRPVGDVRLTVITEKGCFVAVDQRIIIIL